MSKLLPRVPVQWRWRGQRLSLEQFKAIGGRGCSRRYWLTLQRVHGEWQRLPTYQQVAKLHAKNLDESEAVLKRIRAALEAAEYQDHRCNEELLDFLKATAHGPTK